MALTRERFASWLQDYERAWRSPGTGALAELFTADATYRTSPYEDPWNGLAAIAGMWEDEREGPDEPFTMESRIVAVDGDTGVARVDVDYASPPAQEYRDLWVVVFAVDGRCREFEEWPFWPEQPRAG